MRKFLHSEVPNFIGDCRPVWLNKNRVDMRLNGGISGFFKLVKRPWWFPFGFKSGEEFHGIIYHGTARKTKETNPYDYDPIVLYRHGSDGNASCYSDRLFQWDYKLHNALCMVHFGDTSQYWSSRAPAKIEAFLRDYFDDRTIVLNNITEYCNVSNGYPVWYFGFTKNEPA